MGLPQSCYAVERDAQEMDESKFSATNPVLLGLRSKVSARKAEKRLLLVSDNLSRHELLLEAALDSVVTIPVKYSEWSLEDLQKQLIVLAGKPAHQYRTVGLLDHGKPGEFCLLKSIDGGTIDIHDFVKHSEYISFFKFLAEYVQKPLDASAWKNDPHARIDLLACRTYDGKAGQELIDFLEGFTNVNWTASADETGNAKNGFNWIMESDSSVGEVHRDYFDLERIKKWTFSACMGENAWQTYVDDHMVLTQMVTGASICGLDGKTWASNNLDVSSKEILTAVEGFADKTPLYASGLSIAGTNYQFIKGDDKELYVKKGDTGVCIMKGKTFVMFGFHSGDIQTAQCTSTTGKIVDWLVESGM